MPQRRLPFAAFVLTVFAFLIAAPAHAGQGAKLQLSADQCPDVDGLSPQERARVRCGFLRVPEDYAQPAGRTIELAVAIVDPKSNKLTDPVVMLHGGPGVGESERYRYRLNEPLGARTLIIFDQRGVGRSRPQLCPDLGEEYFEASVKGLSVDAETAAIVLAHNRCHDHLLAEKFDLTKYNTDATVADMESLREALGLKRWKVYGISYGTSVGLAYLREHADRISAIALDSVLPLDAPAASHVVVNMMRSLKELSAACAAQASCKARFGNIEELFFKTVEQLRQEPLDVPAIGATTNWTDAVKISAPAFIAVVHQLLYDEAAYQDLPFVIDRVAVRDGEVFALLVDQFHDRLTTSSFGETAAVDCFERYPFDTRESYDQATAEWPTVRENATLIVNYYDICANWAEKAPSPMTMPGKANVPALVLAGSWDPITPPNDSKSAAEQIGAHYVELPFHGHGVRGDQTCGAPMLRAFLDHPEKAPDVACTAHRSPPVFVTGLIRAPAVARELSALSTANLAAAPSATAILALAAFSFVSAAVWIFVGVSRMLRVGFGASAHFWARPGVPIGLAVLAIAGTFVSVGLIVGAAVSPILLMIGFPNFAVVMFALPWAALLCAAWGAWALVRGEGREERPAAYATNLWLVLMSVAAIIALMASLGLLIPETI